MADEYTVTRQGEEPQPAAPAYGDPPGRPGVLLGDISTEEGEKKVAKAAMKLWEARDDYMEPLLCQWKINVARRRGITNGKLIYDSVDDSYEAWFPEDASPDNAPDANKAASLARKFPSIMFADPPAPVVEPSTGENTDEDAAEFSTRALVDIQGKARLNTIKKARTAFDRGNDYGSGFVYYYIEEKGGGRVPIQVIASPTAQDLQTALIAADGLEHGPYATRFVREDGTLTDEKREAATKWAPDIKSAVVTGRNVRPVPHTASDIDECYGVQIGVFETLGKLRQRFPDVFAKYQEEQEQSAPTEGPPRRSSSKDAEEFEKKLTAYKPDHADMLTPQGERVQERMNKDDRDAQLVWVMTTIFTQTADYEQGLFLITLADCYVAYRGKWVYENEGMTEPLLLPIAQFAQFDEGRDSFYKVGAMEILGGANEVRSAQLASQLDWLDKMNNQKIFLPVHSVLDPKQLQFGRATVLYMNPGGEPQYQNLPPYPRESLEMRETLTAEMNDMIGLQETGQGLEAPSINSGKQAMTVLSQVHAAMSEPRQNIELGYLRCCRIELQMARAFLTTPQRWHIVGDDGGYKEDAWRSSDLITDADVILKPGTLSMLSPAAKAQFTEYLYMNLKLIGPDEAKEMIATNLQGVLGLQDDPFRMRIRRQCAAWNKGPPRGWLEQRQQLAMQAQMAPPQPPMGMQPPGMAPPGMGPPPQQPPGPQLMQPGMPPAPPPPPPGPPPVVIQPPPPMIDPMTGMPGPPMPPQIVDPALLAIWSPLLCDTLPNVAALRTAEIAKLMSTTRYERQPPDWRAGVDAEFQRMSLAQAPMMAPEPPNAQGKPSGEPGQPGRSGQKAETPGEKGANIFAQAGAMKLPTQAAGTGPNMGAGG